MTIGERIKAARKSMGMTQADFAERIGLKPTAVLMYEKGSRNVTEQSIALIVQAYNINEEWLRSGHGAMFQECDDAIISQLAEQYKLGGEQVALIKSFLSLTDSQRDAVVAAVCNAADAVSAARKVAAEKDKSQREEAHQLLDMELDAQEKGQSVSTFGSSGTSVNNKQNA